MDYLEATKLMEMAASQGDSAAIQALPRASAGLGGLAVQLVGLTKAKFLNGKRGVIQRTACVVDDWTGRVPVLLCGQPKAKMVKVANLVTAAL